MLDRFSEESLNDGSKSAQLEEAKSNSHNYSNVADQSLDQRGQAAITQGSHRPLISSENSMNPLPHQALRSSIPSFGAPAAFSNDMSLTSLRAYQGVQMLQGRQSELLSGSGMYARPSIGGTNRLFMHDLLIQEQLSGYDTALRKRLVLELLANPQHQLQAQQQQHQQQQQQQQQQIQMQLLQHAASASAGNIRSMLFPQRRSPAPTTDGLLK